jgi:hypothetical protein
MAATDKPPAPLLFRSLAARIMIQLLAHGVSMTRYECSLTTATASPSSSPEHLPAGRLRGLLVDFVVN